MLTNVLSGLVALLLIGVPLVIGIRCLLPRATPVSQAAGLLILFPLVNAPLSFFGSMATPSLNDGYPETGLIPGIVMGVLLLGWLYEDWLKSQLRRWLWVSAGLAAVHWLIMPVIWWLVGYGILYFYESLQLINPDAPPSYSVPAVLIFALLPALAALFNLWMLRRDAKQVNISSGKG